MTENKIKVILHGHGRGEVYLDGVKLPSVTRVESSAAVGEANFITVTMRILCSKIQMEGSPDNDEVAHED